MTTLPVTFVACLKALRSLLHLKRDIIIDRQ